MPHAALQAEQVELGLWAESARLERRPECLEELMCPRKCGALTRPCSAHLPCSHSCKPLVNSKTPRG